MLHVSKRAEKMRPSKLGLIAGQKISVRDAIVALHVKSANDVAVALAEGISGSEESFVKIMNNKAKELGMTHTHFTNASGWHDAKQHSTAVDLAKLAIALDKHYPQHGNLFSKTSFTYKGNVIKGHNKVLAKYPGAKSGKTGFHCPAGFNLVINAERNGKNLVAVVTGGQSAQHRDKKMTALLDNHFGVKTPKIAETKYNKNVKLASGYRPKKGKTKYST